LIAITIHAGNHFYEKAKLQPMIFTVYDTLWNMRQVAEWKDQKIRRKEQTDIMSDQTLIDINSTFS
jgi:hypothetical protein